MNIRKDKKLHFAAGAILAFIGGFYSIYFGIGLAVGYGIGKEIYDYKHPKNHSVELMDALYTFAGAPLGLLPHLIIGIL